MNKPEWHFPMKIGLLFFMIHFWIFYFLLIWIPPYTPFHPLLQVLVFFFDFPIVLISFFGVLHFSFFAERSILGDMYILLSGSFLYFGFGYLLGMHWKNESMKK